MAHRTYTNGEISVSWKSELCTHCGNCFAGRLEVFDADRRPWVDMSKGTTKEISDQVSQCPSGALTLI